MDFFYFNQIDRQAAFKKGIDADESRRRRGDTQLQIRKNKKEEGLQKRRALATSGTNSSLSNSFTNSITEPNIYSNDATNTNQTSKKVYTPSDIPQIISSLQKPNVTNDELHEAIMGFRKMLSVEKNPPVREVLDCGALPFFVQLLTKQDSSEIQFEAAWALTNVASTEYTSAVVHCGDAVPNLVALLSHQSCANVREQSAWCLGNIAGDSPEFRDYVLQCGALRPL